MLVVQDTFTDTNGTTLASHVGELGATWVRASGTETAVVNSNRLEPQLVASPSYYYTSGIPGAADYDVSIDFIVLTTGVPRQQFFSVDGRGSITDEGYRWGYSYFAPNWLLSKIISGAETSLGTYTGIVPAASNTYKTKLRLRGSTISGLINDAVVVSTPDTSLTSAGRNGLTVEDGNAPGTGSIFDNYAVEDILQNPSMIRSKFPKFLLRR